MMSTNKLCSWEIALCLKQLNPTFENGYKFNLSFVDMSFSKTCLDKIQTIKW